MPRTKPTPNLYTNPSDLRYLSFDSSQITNINFPVGDHAAQNSYKKIPDLLKIAIWFEQTHNDKRYDSDYFPPPGESSLASQYLPESRNLIKLLAFRINNNLLEVFSTANTEFSSLLSEDAGHSTLVIHPSLFDDEQARDLFNSLFSLGCTISNRIFYFLPAASPRTGLTWELGHEERPFFTKMSIKPLDRNQPKSDLSPEGKTAVVNTHALLTSASTMKDSFFHDEHSVELQTIYKTQIGCSLNVMFRKIPSEMLYGNGLYIPFFALASTPERGIKPLFIQLLEQSGLSLAEFLETSLFLPAHKFILDNTRSQVFAHHLHGQNLLIKLKISPLASTYHLAGLDAKLKYRDATDMQIGVEAEPAELKQIRMRNQLPPSSYTPGAYLYRATSNFIKCSIVPIFFALKDWQTAGWLSTSIEIDHTKLIMPFFNQITHYLLSQMKHSHPQIANDAFNTLYEFTHLACEEQRMVKGTRREREWLNLLAKIHFSLYQELNGAFQIDATRANLMQEHLKIFKDEQMRLYQGVDQMQAEQFGARGQRLEQQYITGSHLQQSCDTTSSPGLATIYSSTQWPIRTSTSSTNTCIARTLPTVNSWQITAEATPWQTVNITELPKFKH